MVNWVGADSLNADVEWDVYGRGWAGGVLVSACVGLAWEMCDDAVAV